MCGGVHRGRYHGIMELPRPSLALLVVLLLRAPLLAQGDHHSLLADLANADFTVRERATAALAADISLTPEAITELYAAATLPEQRHRLRTVARHHLVRPLQEAESRNGGPGSLGIGLAPGPPSGEPHRAVARVTQTLPGFPAFVHLVPGDLILEVDGRPVPRGNAMEATLPLIGLIQSRQAGEVLRLTVVRHGQRMAVDVPLASLAALEQLYQAQQRGPHPQVQALWHRFERALAERSPPPEPLRVPRAEDG